MSPTDSENAYIVMAWAMDFCRALRSNQLARLLFRGIAGRAAFREFIGLQDALQRAGYTPYLDYGLDELSYHNDATPAQWWVEREPKSRDSQAVTA